MYSARGVAHAADDCEQSFEAREDCAFFTGIVIASDTVGASGLLSMAAPRFRAGWSTGMPLPPLSHPPNSTADLRTLKAICLTAINSLERFPT